MKKIAVVNGPNLNLLGQREKDIYGTVSLEEIRRSLEKTFQHACRLAFFQSNSEGELVGYIQGLSGGVDGIVINAGAYTHTSVAIRDALLAVGVPFVEVHLSNIFAREEFRHRSTLADKALGIICGFGPAGYGMAVEGLLGVLAD
ncbi:MAG TPA: type II 3-dehydroquinate dehydratase [archaeon]|nr:type II 3-dehydroquinate dehydratase [archaeon]